MPATAGARLLLAKTMRASSSATLPLRSALTMSRAAAAAPRRWARCDVAWTKQAHAMPFSTSHIPRLPASKETQSYRFNHTMLRVKDPEKSLHFYTEILGMDLIDEHDADSFKLFFLGYQHQKGVPRGEREALLELTWNKGTEKDESFSYASGNDEPGKGFGHIAIAVDDVQTCQDRLLKHGVKFKKLLQDGNMKTIAFAYDPDGYWVELVPSKK